MRTACHVKIAALKTQDRTKIQFKSCQQSVGALCLWAPWHFNTRPPRACFGLGVAGGLELPRAGVGGHQQQDEWGPVLFLWPPLAWPARNWWPFPPFLFGQRMESNPNLFTFGGILTEHGQPHKEMGGDPAKGLVFLLVSL